MGATEEGWAESLAAHTVAANERWGSAVRKIERAGERHSVAGYDMTFSSPKSVSVLQASAPDIAAQRAVRAAHHVGVRAVMAALECDGAFDHRTSRTGDPQMHTHVAVLAMAKTAEGEVFWVGRAGRLRSVRGDVGRL